MKKTQTYETEKYLSNLIPPYYDLNKPVIQTTLLTRLHRYTRTYIIHTYSSTWYIHHTTNQPTNRPNTTPSGQVRSLTIERLHSDRCDGPERNEQRIIVRIGRIPYCMHTYIRNMYTYGWAMHSSTAPLRVGSAGSNDVHVHYTILRAMHTIVQIALQRQLLLCCAYTDT